MGIFRLPVAVMSTWTYLEHMGRNRNGLFSRAYIFHAHVLYREVLISQQSSALVLIISRKNTKVEAFLPRKILQEDD